MRARRKKGHHKERKLQTLALYVFYRLEQKISLTHTHAHGNAIKEICLRCEKFTSNFNSYSTSRALPMTSFQVGMFTCCVAVVITIFDIFYKKTR